jgi:hypothetical protein
METTVTLNTDSLKNLTKALKAKSKLAVKVGVMADSNSRTPVYPNDRGLTNSQIAYKHEFGIGVPVRSILRKPMMTLMGSRLNNVPESTWKESFDSSGIYGMLEVVGQVGVKLVDDNFDSQGIPTGWRELSDATIANRKRYNRPSKLILKDSKQLESSFGYEVVK